MTLPEARRVFADLMQQARTGTLTEHARRRLAQARQLLRRARRPAMNPTGKRQFVITKVKQGRSLYWSATGFHPDVKYAEKFHNKDEAQRWIDQHAAYDAGYRDAFPEPIGKLTRPQFKNPQPPGNYREYHAAKYTTSGARKQIAGLMKQGWEFDRTVIYPSGKINFHLLNEGRTAILDEDGKINMLYPVGTKVFDALKGRDVTQGYGAEPNPRRKQSRLRPRSRISRNPAGNLQRIGRAVEVRYHRTIGKSPGYYKHEIQSSKAVVYTIPPGWVYVSTKSILITEREPRVPR